MQVAYRCAQEFWAKFTPDSQLVHTHILILISVTPCAARKPHAARQALICGLHGSKYDDMIKTDISLKY